MVFPTDIPAAQPSVKPTATVEQVVQQPRFTDVPPTAAPVQAIATPPPTPAHIQPARTTAPTSPSLNCQNGVPYFAQAQAVNSDKYFLPVPEWNDTSPNAQVQVCIYDVSIGAPVSQGEWRNGNLNFPRHSITRVDGKVTVMSVIFPSQKTMTANAPIEFIDPNPMNDTVRGLIAGTLSQFNGVLIYENCRSCGDGASAQFRLSTP